MVVWVLVTVVIGVVLAVVVAVELPVDVAVVVCVVSAQSLNVPSWKESIAVFSNATALQESLMSLIRPEPLQPKTPSPFTSPRVI